MYEHGHGVAQDYAQARGWYRRAAGVGHAPAAERLSRLLAAQGGGVSSRNICECELIVQK
jgi:TPR repeat protein